MSNDVESLPEGGDVCDVAFRLESYGADDSKVLRYFNGCIIRESDVRDYFTARASLPSDNSCGLEEALDRCNNENWHITASTLCMASSIWAQKSTPVEWDEARTHQQNANQVFAKARALLDCLHSSQRLRLNHAVSPHKSSGNVVKYAITSRNGRLAECASKSRELGGVVSRSIGVQINFLRVVSEIKTQFKVLLNVRNHVDVSSLDVDYPASFSVFVLFYDMDFRMELEGDSKVWEAWDVHRLSNPGTPQQCLVSYYEDNKHDANLMTKMTFPTVVSHFIERNYALTVNGAHVPVYTREGQNPVVFRLRVAQMCLIDRFIFTSLCQSALEPLRSQQPISVDGISVFVKSMTSERLSFVFEGQILELRYTSCGDEETGEVVWRLVLTKLRDLALESWKRQVYERVNEDMRLFSTFLRYTVNLFTKFTLT
ncbi:extracellular ligand-binding receptor, putative [Babesia ovis]|uniref:Extracellular ligand-binding receptor, putative n=1 Tax=Babesia ovis TaxID=5869 RepID=A0A9W5TD91_BABOV|nr:extracellular ligand-binding receptor, putative [Babesia ovis]